MSDDPFAQIEEYIAALKKYRVDIEKALWYGNNTHTYEDVCANIIAGQLDLHILDGAILIAETLRYPAYDVYNVFIAAGELEPIIQAQRGYLIREAQRRGAKRLSFAGRRGWLPTLKKEGWTSELVIMSKEVPDGKITHAGKRTEHQSGLGERGQQPVRDTALHS